MKQHTELHVLYIITKLELGGAQKVCLSLAQGLAQSGTSTTLISGTKGPLVEQAKKTTNTILLDSFTREASLFSLFKELRCFFHLIKKIRDVKKKYPNLIVHTHSTKAGLMGRWAAFFAGIKKRVHTVHGYGFHPHQSWFTWLPIYALELITSFITTHYVCVSSEDVKTGIKLFPYFSKKQTVIRAAIDWQQFYTPARIAQPFPAKNEPFIFGTVACFKKQKNLFDLLKAFELVIINNPNTRLEIIGDGILKTSLEEWISDHHLTHIVTLHGWKKEVAPSMMNWHAFVLSSLWEGLPCAVVEARMLKLPVISYNTGGIQDVIYHGKNGLLCQQKNWQKLADNMLKVAKENKTYTNMQQHTENLDHFSANYMIKKHAQLYKSL